jgi:hypothetical protein
MKYINRRKKSQSLLEYILVTVAFTTVGMVTFFAALRTTAITRQGTAQTYYSKDTDMGKVVNTGVTQEEMRWPSKFGTYAGDANNYEGTIQQEQIATPDPQKGYTQGQPRGDLYEYKPLNWSINQEIERDQQGI